VIVDATTEDDATDTVAEVTCEAMTDEVSEAALAEVLEDTMVVLLTVLRAAIILLI